MFSSQVSQQLYMSQLSMSQQMQQAQMLSMQMGLMPMMPAMPQMNLASAVSNMGTGGMYGEQVANRMLGAAQMTGTMGMLGVGMLGAAAGIPLDPFSAALKFGRAGFASAGIGGAAMGAIGGALPFYAGSQILGAYTGAFRGGMQDQAATNAMLRQNFNFLGGGGAFGRGFSQQQMGQIGGMISAETHRTPYTSSGELNQLIQGGQEMGMFNAVRDVESFSRRFKSMIESLRKIQNELGGTLSDALAFTRGTQQLGIFTSGGRQQFASEMRDTMGVTGMNQNQIFSLAATGSMLSRAAGGLGRQGAVGALRTARQLGSALSTGAINQELLSEATGGLQGDEAIQALSAQTMQMANRFSRTGAGRYSLFALSNAAGTGLDEGMLARFRAGDISVGGIMRSAHANVNRMGRARALNQEGQLRGALMEEGGMSAQLGILRLQLGERALSGSDDLAQLFMQRRMGVSQSQAQLYTSLLRNQGSIASNEAIESGIGRRQQAEQRDIMLNRSVDSFMQQFHHGIAEVSGVNRAREMGRNFLTRVSTTIERAVNDVVGATASALTMEDRRSIARIATGRGTSEDVLRMTFSNRGAGGVGGDPFATSSTNALLRTFGMHSAQTLGEVMEGRGVNFRGMSAQQQDLAVRRMEQAQLGMAFGNDLPQMRALRDAGTDTVRRLAMAHAAGGREAVYQSFGSGVSANAIDAAAQRLGFNMGSNDYMLPNQRRGGVEANLGMIAERMAGGAAAWGSTGAGIGGVLAGVLTAGAGTGAGVAVGGALGALGGGLYEGFNALTQVTQTDQDRAIGFLARGGHANKYARTVLGLEGSRGNSMGVNQRDVNMSRQQAALIASLHRDKGMLDLHGEKPVSEETMRKVLGSDQVHMALKRIQASGGRAQAEELAALERYGSTLAREEQRAVQSLANQARHNLQTQGGIGEEFVGALNEKDRNEAAMAEYRNYASGYAALADKITDTGLRSAIGRTTSALYGYDAAAAQRESVGAVRRISELTDEQLNQESKALGSEESGRLLLMEGMRRKNQVTQIMGKGRRRGAGGADALFGELTGHTMGDIDLKIGDRTLDKRRQSRILMEEWRRGGETADKLTEQLATHLKGKGIEKADEYLAEARAGVMSKGLDQKEVNDLLDKLNVDRNVSRVANENVAAKQRANDPLGFDRNEILKDIRTGINVLAKIDPEKNQSVDPSQKGNN